jgi:hypothetical protein
MPDQMPIQKYDVQIPYTERFEEKRWRIINIPIFDETHAIQYILNTVTDVTKLAGGESL